MFLFTALLLRTLAADPFPVVTLKTPAGAHEPQVAVGADGRVFVTYGTTDTVYVSVSTDSGASFGDPIEVGRAGVLSLGMRRGPRIAADRMLVANPEMKGPGAYLEKPYVAISAIGGEQGGGRDGDVLLWSSVDDGRTWSFQGQLNDVKGAAREGLHAMASSWGSVCCVWIDGRSEQPAIWGCWAGVNSPVPSEPSPDRNECIYRPAGGSICPCCHPSVVFGSKSRPWPARVMWRSAIEGSRDMVLAEWSRRGVQQIRATKLGKGTWKLAACPMDGGAIAIDANENVQSVWRREGEIFLADDKGHEQRIGAGEQPWIAAGADGIYIVWIEKRGGALFLSHQGSGGRVRLAEDANDPVVAAPSDSKGAVIAAWESGSGDDAKIRVARVDSRPEPAPK